MIPAANVSFMWHTVIDPRRGTPYNWGGSFDPNDVSVGTDCSGAVSAVIEALVHGPNMNWQRQFWTGTFQGLNPGDVGPYGLVCIAGPDDHPPDAAAIVAIRQGPSADSSHMMVQVGGTNIEDGDGLVTGPGAADIHDGQFNQWFYLPGPVTGATPPPPPPQTPVFVDTPLVAALRAKGFSPELIRLVQGFSLVEGLNPAGNPTLGFTDSQLGGATDLQSHVDALAQQFRDREPVAGAFPQGGTDQEQAQWIAHVVGQAGVGSDWQGNAQPQDYVQRVVDAMQRFPVIQGPPPQPPSPPQPGDDFMSELSAQEQRAFYNKIMVPDYSRSPLRAPGQGPIITASDAWRNTDGSVHIIVDVLLAWLGHPGKLAELRELAATDLPDRQQDRQLAVTILDRITKHTPLPSAPPSPQPPVYAPPPAPVPVTPNLPAVPGEEPETMGDDIKELCDALEGMKLADSLPIDKRATLAAVIAVLQTKNGSQLSP